VAVVAALEPRLQQLLPQLFLLWFFATPVVYPRSMLPDALGRIVSLNPMTHVVEGTQSILVVAAPGSALSWLVLIVTTAFSCALGLWLVHAKRRALLDLL
jgi:lipopolysaccharide transport system permease protein